MIALLLGISCQEAEGPIECSTDFECDVLQFCNLFEKTCANAECNAPDDCAAGLACDEAAQSCEYAQACDGDDDCASTEVCRRTGFPFGTCAAACVAPPVRGEVCSFSTDEGDPCAFFASSCAEGLECAVEDVLIEKRSRCKAPADVGQSCLIDDTTRDGCAAGLVCKITQLGDLDGTCEEAAGEGNVCLLDERGDLRLRHQCAAGLTCTGVVVDNAERRELRCQ